MFQAKYMWLISIQNYIVRYHCEQKFVDGNNCCHLTKYTHKFKESDLFLGFHTIKHRKGLVLICGDGNRPSLGQAYSAPSPSLVWA